MITATRHRRALTGGIAAMLFGAALGAPGVVGAQEDADFRTTVEGLSGYSGAGEGSPMSIQFYNATGGSIPTDPGESEFEATESYTRSVLGTGPQSRATASSAWPGPTFGDGFATVCECGEDYFIRADARYPEGPYEDEQGSPQTGSGMFAAARGLDVEAQAASSESPNPDGAGFGNSSSVSTATVDDEGLVVTHVDAAIQDVSIGGGALTIESVRTVMTATSDGQTATTEGTTTVKGFTFLGVPFHVDEDGVRAGGEDSTTPPPGDVVTPEQMGITVEFVEHEETVEGARGSRFAGGLIITIDTNSFAEGIAAFEEESGQELPIDPLVPPQTGIDEDLDGAIAQAYVSVLFPFLTGSADVRYTFARGRVSAAASPPFEMPDFDPPDFEAPPATSNAGPGTAPPPPSFGSAPTPPTTSAAPPTQVAPPDDAGQVLAAAPELPDWFDGLPFVLFLLGAMVAGIGAYGLNGLSAAALGTGSSEFCETGAPKRVPQLRQG